MPIISYLNQEAVVVVVIVVIVVVAHGFWKVKHFLALLFYV